MVYILYERLCCEFECFEFFMGYLLFSVGVVECVNYFQKLGLYWVGGGDGVMFCKCILVILLVDVYDGDVVIKGV